MNDEELRAYVAEAAVVAVREALRTIPRGMWIAGVVRSVDATRMPPEAAVAIEGYSGLTHAQCLAITPLVGERVVVVFASPAQAFTIPFGESVIEGS